MALILDFYNSSNSKSQQKNITWNNGTDINTKGNWATGASDIYYTYEIENINATQKRIKIQYGLNVSGWATNVFYIFDLTELLTEELSDGSYNVSGKLALTMYAARQTDFVLGGVQVTSKGSLLGVELFNITRLTSEEFTSNFTSKIQSFSSNVKPQQTYKESGLKISSVYPNGEFPNATMLVGFQFKNTNVPQYKPMAIRKSSVFKTLNVSSGKIQIRKSGTFIDKSLEDNATSLQANKGKNRIRLNGEFKQLPKIY